MQCITSAEEKHLAEQQDGEGEALKGSQSTTVGNTAPNATSHDSGGEATTHISLAAG
jgi:hypothetical protein